MLQNTSGPGWATILYAIVVVALLGIGVFRLDELFARKKRPVSRSKTSTRQFNRPGGALTDPDGKLSKGPR